MLMIFCIIAMGSYLYPEIYSSSWRLWVAAALLPAIALTIGYTAASIFCMTHASRRAIAIEIGCQNAAIAYTLITLSYDDDVFLFVAAYAGIYTVLAYVIIFGLIGVYYLHKYIRKRGNTFEIAKEHELQNIEKKISQETESTRNTKIINTKSDMESTESAEIKIGEDPGFMNRGFEYK